MVYETVMAVLSNQYVQHSLLGLGRSFLGWMENCFEDGKVTKYEGKLLIASVIRVGFLSWALCFLGLPLGTAIPMDYGYMALKKAGTKTPK